MNSSCSPQIIYRPPNLALHCLPKNLRPARCLRVVSAKATTPAVFHESVARRTACVNCFGKCVNILNVLSRTSPPAIDPKPSQAANTVQEVDKPGLHRQRCVVHGCKELIAPSMWKYHLNLHTQSILPGSVPEDWLGQNNMVICSYCFHLVASISNLNMGNAHLNLQALVYN